MIPVRDGAVVTVHRHLDLLMPGNGVVLSLESCLSLPPSTSAAHLFKQLLHPHIYYPSLQYLIVLIFNFKSFTFSITSLSF